MRRFLTSFQTRASSSLLGKQRTYGDHVEGNVKQKVAPRSTLALAHRWPPCDSMIRRLDNPVQFREALW